MENKSQMISVMCLMFQSGRTELINTETKNAWKKEINTVRFAPHTLVTSFILFSIITIKPDLYLSRLATM